MKKGIRILSVFLLVCLLAACGKQDAQVEPTQQKETETILQANTEPTQQGETEPTQQTETEPTQQGETEPTQQAETEPTQQGETEPTQQTETEPTQPKETEPKETDKPAEPTVGHTHSYTSTVTAPTCEKGGQTTHKCDCGDSYVTDKTNATGHNWGEWVTVEESTTSKNGTAERKCSVCGKTETKKLDKLPTSHSHSYTSKVVASTCTSEGYTVHTCSCGDAYVDSQTAKSAHTYVDTVTKPTCTTEGYTMHKCSKCGGNYVDSKVAATGHQYADTVVESTCDNGGYTTHKCSACGHTYQDANTSAKGHNYQTTSDTATCTTDGQLTKTCSNCGNTKTETSQAKGHGSTRTETTAATCTEAGAEKTICNVCNTVISEKVIEGSGTHSWEYKPCNEVVQDEMNRGLLSQPKYAGFTDHCVAVCSVCKTSNWDDIVLKYSDYEAAEIMLGYVNDLRESVLGTNEYNLKLDNGLVEYAKLRAIEISTDFSHNSKYAENIASAGHTIYEQFLAWKNSTEHHNNMIYAAYDSVGYRGHTHFGYAMYRVGTTLYGVQIFADW